MGYQWKSFRKVILWGAYHCQMSVPVSSLITCTGLTGLQAYRQGNRLRSRPLSGTYFYLAEAHPQTQEQVPVGPEGDLLTQVSVRDLLSGNHF